MPFIVVYDACVLFPPALRDFLIRLGRSEPRMCQVKWTRRILDECFRGILRERPHLPAEKLARTRELLEQAILDVEVTGYEDLIEGITGLPDPDDRHVVAAAIRCGAQVIVTHNLKDFPVSVLGRYGMEAQHPDEFVRDLIDLDAHTVVRELQRQAASLKNPPKTPTEILESLRQQGLSESCASLEALLTSVPARRS
jgi:hypothetical protein